MQDMSAEVVDSNPYSRLMALQRMGIVENYEKIRDFSVAIVVCIHLNTHLSLSNGNGDYLVCYLMAGPYDTNKK